MISAALEDTTWTADARDLIERVSREGIKFDANTLQEEYGLRQPPHPNMLGSLFSYAHRRGWITKVSYHSSQKRSRAGGGCYVWQGVTEENSERAAA